MKFTRQNHNEFKTGVRWHDYFAIMVNEFPVILVRKYDWPLELFGDDRYTVMVQVLGFKVYHYVGVAQ